MHYKNKNHTTVKYQNWAHNILHLLNNDEIEAKLELIRTEFDPEKHRYVVDLIFNFPKHILFTQTKIMSAKAFDVSNVEKPLIDLIFLPKYFDRPSPYGAKNLNIDDKYISDLSSKKRATTDGTHSIDVTIQLLPLSDIQETEESQIDSPSPKDNNQDEK